MSENRYGGPGDSSALKPRVSIVIPCYNCHTFVSESIESALGQSYGNVEVVVVDDGSTDVTPQIAQSYPVRFVQGTHQGVSAARNLGIRASTGEYLMFLDCDDRLLPDAVALGLAVLAQNPTCAIAVGAHNLITQSGDLIATRHKPAELRDGYESLLYSNFIECTASVLFRRWCFNGDIRFRRSLHGAEDYEVYLRVARLAPICCHDRTVAEYRIHSSNSSRNSKMMLSHTLDVVAEQWPFARKSFRHMLACLRGSLTWRRKYGRQLTAEMIVSGGERPLWKDREAWRLLATSYPLGIPMVLIARMLPRGVSQAALQRAKRRRVHTETEPGPDKHREVPAVFSASPADSGPAKLSRGGRPPLSTQAEER